MGISGLDIQCACCLERQNKNNGQHQSNLMCEITKQFLYSHIHFTISVQNLWNSFFTFLHCFVTLRKDHKKIEFELHEVYGVDVYISTGDGKSRERDVRTTVYKKSEQTYALKMKASRSKYILFYNLFPQKIITLIELFLFKLYSHNNRNQASTLFSQGFLGLHVTFVLVRQYLKVEKN